MRQSWIGVDLDGTLAKYEGAYNEMHFGAPIWPMVKRVKKWLDDGRRVKVFTARVSPREDEHDGKVIAAIHQFLTLVCGLPALEVTCVKDYQMVELYDDRAYHVIPNSGLVVLPPPINEDEHD